MEIRVSNIELGMQAVGSTPRINSIKRIKTDLISALSPTDPAMVPNAKDKKVAPRTAVRKGVDIVIDGS